jgi:hypothetical protein
MSQVQDVPYEKERSIYLSDYYHRVHISLSKKERAISQMTIIECTSACPFHCA